MFKETLTRWFIQIKGGAIHPLILPIFPVLSLYLSNLGEGFLSQAVPILGGICVLSLIGWGTIYVLLKDANKSAFLVSMFFVLFFSFGHGLTVMRIVLERLALLDTLWFVLYGKHSRLFWALLWVVIVAALTVFVVRKKNDLARLTEFLNFVAIAFLVISLANFFLAGGFSLYLRPLIGQIITPHLQQETVSPIVARHDMPYRAFLPYVVRSEPGDPRARHDYENVWLADLPTIEADAYKLPDIYYIVPDMYIRADYLSDIYKCDVSDFLDFLEARGFYVAYESRSNYAFTTHSLASSLNYMYLSDVAQQMDYIDGQSLSSQMIEQNRIMMLLKTLGYTTVAFDTGFWFTSLEKADIYMKPPVAKWNPGEFESGVFRLTPLSAFSVFGQSRDEAYRQRTLYTLEHIPEATEIATPTFVFAHILSPHDPFVFDAYGAPILSQDGYTYEEYVDVYCGQVLHINRRLQEVVSEILARSSEPPIIIIQSDHGAVYGTDFAAYVNERMSILNAYYFPHQDYEALYPGITPVNTFRVVLNNYFGAGYPLLEDLSYFGASYDFVDVTQEVIGNR